MVRYQSHRTAEVHGGGKLTIEFVIIDGPYSGVQVEAYYPTILNGLHGVIVEQILNLL